MSLLDDLADRHADAAAFVVEQGEQADRGSSRPGLVCSSEIGFAGACHIYIPAFRLSVPRRERKKRSGTSLPARGRQSKPPLT